MTLPDDATDLDIHNRIDLMISVFMSMRAMTRAQVIDDLCSGDGKFDHGLNAIAEMFSITRHEVNERVSAFIEAEKEEAYERALMKSLAAEVDA